MECPICGAWAGDDPETGYMADSPCPNCIAQEGLLDWMDEEIRNEELDYLLGSDPGDEDGV